MSINSVKSGISLDNVPDSVFSSQKKAKEIDLESEFEIVEKSEVESDDETELNENCRLTYQVVIMDGKKVLVDDSEVNSPQKGPGFFGRLFTKMEDGVFSLLDNFEERFPKPKVQQAQIHVSHDLKVMRMKQKVDPTTAL